MNATVSFLIEQGYVILFLWILFEQLGLPIPAAPILVAAGALAGIGKMNYGLVFGLAALAALLGDQFWYQVGLRRGGKVLSLLCRVSYDPDSCVRRTKDLFVRYGARSLLIAKFIPGMTMLAPPLAAIARVRLLRFLFFDLLGTFIWVGILTLLGYQFGDELEEFMTARPGMGMWIGLIVPVALVAYIAWKYSRRKRFLQHLAVMRITPEEVKWRLDSGDGVLILDLRSAFEFTMEPRTLPGAFRITFEELERDHHQIPRDREIVLFCN
jgi:membrane protein DedA with SNARE-associated domain